jgi:ribonuclease HII
MKGFDFHDLNLATDETRMKHSFCTKDAEAAKKNAVFASFARPKNQADNAPKRARLGTRMAATFSDRFEFERTLWERNLTRVAGVDEAGRGPLAGPVVAAAAILPARWAESGLPSELDGLNDSKQLSFAQREKFFAFLTACNEVKFAVAQIDSLQIDEINILRATHQAMNAALAELNPQPQHALVDGRPVKTMRVPQTAIIKGDARSYSIAAASVLAKVARDRLMLEFDRQWPAYGFAEHKGYGTAQHLAALAAHGPCPIHRRSFAPLKPKEQELFPTTD